MAEVVLPGPTGRADVPAGSAQPRPRALPCRPRGCCSWKPCRAFRSLALDHRLKHRRRVRLDGGQLVLAPVHPDDRDHAVVALDHADEPDHRQAAVLGGRHRREALRGDDLDLGLVVLARLRLLRLVRLDRGQVLGLELQELRQHGLGVLAVRGLPGVHHEVRLTLLEQVDALEVVQALADVARLRLHVDALGDLDALVDVAGRFGALAGRRLRLRRRVGLLVVAAPEDQRQHDADHGDDSESTTGQEEDLVAALGAPRPAAVLRAPLLLATVLLLPPGVALLLRVLLLPGVLLALVRLLPRVLRLLLTGVGLLALVRRLTRLALVRRLTRLTLVRRLTRLTL